MKAYAESGGGGGGSNRAPARTNVVRRVGTAIRGATQNLINRVRGR